jgi:hypothetical protein
MAGAGQAAADAGYGIPGQIGPAGTLADIPAGQLPGLGAQPPGAGLAGQLPVPGAGGDGGLAAGAVLPAAAAGAGAMGAGGSAAQQGAVGPQAGIVAGGAAAGLAGGAAAGIPGAASPAAGGPAVPAAGGLAVPGGGGLAGAGNELAAGLAGHGAAGAPAGYQPAGQQGGPQPGQAALPGVPPQYQTRPLAAGNYRDVLPPVRYPPPAARPNPAGVPGRQPGGAPRSAWSPFVLGVLIAAVAVSVAFPVAGTATALGVLILLRAADLTGNLLAARRSRRASGPADPLVAAAYFPLALLRSVLRFLLLAPLALLAAFIAAAIAIMVVVHHQLPLATALAAGALVAVYCVGPGSSAVRRPLSRCVPASGNPVTTAVSLCIVAAVALAAISLAAPRPPSSFWPAKGTPGSHLLHHPALHSVVADVRDSLMKLAGHLG